MLGTSVITLFLILVASLFLRYPIIGTSAIFLLSTPFLFSALKSKYLMLVGIPWSVTSIGLGLFLIIHALRLRLSSNKDYEWLGSTLFLGLAVFLSCSFNKNPIHLLRESIPYFAYLAGGYFIGVNLHKERDLPVLKGTAAAGLLISLAFSVFHYFSPGNSPEIPLLGRVTQNNYCTIYITCLFPFLFWQIKEAKTLKAEIGGIAMFCMFLLLMAISGSLSEITGVLLITALFFLSIGTGLFPKKYLTWLLPLLAVGLLHLMTRGGSFIEPIQKWIEYLDQAWLKKLDFHTQIEHGFYALNVFCDHPFLGVGYGQLEHYLINAYPGIEFAASPENGSLFTIFAETGLFGGLAFAWLFVILFYPMDDKEFPCPDEDKWLRKAVWISSLLLGFSTLLYSIHLHLFTFCMMGILRGIRTNRIASLPNDRN